MTRRSNNQRSRPPRRSELISNRLRAPVHHRVTWDYLDFDVSTSATISEGRLMWNANEGVLEVGLQSLNAVQQIGLETYVRIKADETISNGKVVMSTGAIGNSGLLTGALAFGLAADEGDQVLGIATHTMLPNESGYVTNFGVVRGIDTTGSEYSQTWSDGISLYLDTSIAGGLTKVKGVSAPSVHLGHILRAHQNGQILVRLVTNGGEGVVPIISRPPISLAGIGGNSNFTTTYSTTLTLVSVTGPGVLKVISAQPGWSIAGVANISIKLYIDGVFVQNTDYSWSNFSSPIYLVGGSDNMDRLCFSSSFTIAVNNFSATSRTYAILGATYHITE